MRETRVCTHRFSAAIAVLLLAVILILGAVPACFADPISVVDAGFEAGAEGAVLASPPWVANGTPQHREYDDARAKVGTKSAWIQGPATASNAGVYETSSAGMTSNGSEMRFWAYFDTANQSRLLDDYAPGVAASGRALGIQFGGDGTIKALTDRAGNPNGYTTGSYTTVGTYSSGWTEFRVVYTFTGTGAQTYTLSKRASSSESWTQLKAAGATGYAIPFKGANTITTTHGTLWRGYNGASIWVDDLRFSATGIKDTPSPTTWSGIQPTGTFGAGAVITAQGVADATYYPLVAPSARLLVDGVELPAGSYLASVTGNRVYFYCTPSGLSDGPHTFRVQVADTVGTVSSYEWGAISSQPPSASFLSPAEGATVFNGHPGISMTLSDNTPLTTFAVAGQVHEGSATGPIAATFEGTGLSEGINPFIFRLSGTGLPGDLAPGTYVLTATTTASGGGTASATPRTFTIAAPPAMTVLETCEGCHPAVRAAHPTPATAACTVCHPGKDGDHMQGTENCEDCHASGWHNGHAKAEVTITGPCTDCHTAERPEVIQHTAASVAPSHTGSCGGCHTNTSLTAKHGFTPVGSLYANQCDLCHGAGASARVKAAIAAGSTACNGCHDAQPGHGYSAEQHAASGSGAMSGTWTPTLLPTTVFAGELVNPPLDYSVPCTTCHSTDLATEHAKPTSVPVNESVCADCHATPRDTIVGAWDKSCATGGCHTVVGQEQHPATARLSDHAVAASIKAEGPSGAGCSASPGTVENSYQRTPCHTTDLIQEHNRKIGGITPSWQQLIAKTISVSCDECHSSAAYASLNGSWDGTCVGCHPASHAVEGSARNTQVRALHEAPRYYDSGNSSRTGTPIQGSNAMDAHGPVRTAPTGTAVPYGCANQLCHLHFYVEPGLSGMYPANTCANCHGENIAPLTPFQGAHMWSSGAWSDGQDLHTSLTLAVPGTLPAASALDFKTFYDIEQGWDYGYVQVSADGGSTWTSLASSLTTNDDPNMQNLGNGITGASGDWVDGHFDLSAYAGQSVLIRFDYVTDAYVFGEGWSLDTVTVGPSGAPVFSDDAETLKPEWTVASNRTTQWTR